MDKTSPYDAKYEPHPLLGHVVLAGQPSFLSLSYFLSELYHSDHGEQSTHVVILNPKEPTDEVKELMEESTHTSNSNSTLILLR